MRSGTALDFRGRRWGRRTRAWWSSTRGPPPRFAAARQLVVGRVRCRTDDPPAQEGL